MRDRVQGIVTDANAKIGEAVWGCIGLHMQMLTEGTGEYTAMAITSALYRGKLHDIANEIRRGERW